MTDLDDNVKRDCALRLISEEEFEDLLANPSPSTKYRLERDDPDFPRAVWRGGRRCRVAAEVQRYLEVLIKRSAEPGASPWAINRGKKLAAAGAAKRQQSKRGAA